MNKFSRVSSFVVFSIISVVYGLVSHFPIVCCFFSFAIAKATPLGLPDHLKIFQGRFVFQRDTVDYFRERLQGGETGVCHPATWD